MGWTNARTTGGQYHRMSDEALDALRRWGLPGSSMRDKDIKE